MTHRVVGTANCVAWGLSDSKRRLSREFASRRSWFDSAVVSTSAPALDAVVV